ADTLQNLIPNENYSNVSQFIYTANDLVQSGLQIGEINSIKIYVTKGAHADLLKIGLKGVTDDTLIWKNRSVDVETHYMQSVNLKEGWVSFPFEKPFAWNGTENILVEFETVNFNNSDKIEILGDVTSKSMGISHGTSSKYLSLDGAGDYVNMGKQAQIDGGKERTIEVWAKTKSFNNGGLFQAGLSGTLRDFTLRTMTGDNKWRIQLWGADGDVTLDESKDNWQHYALVYNGKSTTLYYNGEFIRLKNAELNTPDADLRIGRWQGSFFNGDVDNMRIWESALSAYDLKKYASIKVDSLHPDLENLKAVYSFDEKNSGFVQNEIANGEKGVLWGDAWFKNHAAIEDFTQGQNLNARPMLVFENGVYNELTEIREVREPVLRKPTTVELYGNAANGMIIEDDSKKHPSLVTDTLIVWPAGGYSYVYNELTGQKLDSTFIQITGSLQKENKEWYSPTVRYEIGRYITPYGINLTLGKKGFTWVYDVTDYAPLLFDSIDLSAGNQQELIDLKIAFVKGTPTHNVKRIDAIWPFGSYSYKNLDNDVSLKENEIALENDAETFLVRTRLTGHGHNSTDGEFPHCCEWKDNTHYLFVDGNQVADWHIWREDCDLNPVYPQGGNW
ncbi:MAG: LamG-like jellyroll fold domain-containing protein, partial [Bacteroidia bacterium]